MDKDESMDELDCQKFEDSRTGSTILFTFTSDEDLVIDLSSKELNPEHPPEDDIHLPLVSVYMNIRTGETRLGKW